MPRGPQEHGQALSLHQVARKASWGKCPCDGDEDEGHSRWKEQHVQRPQTGPLFQPVERGAESLDLSSCRCSPNRVGGGRDGNAHTGRSTGQGRRSLPLPSLPGSWSPRPPLLSKRACPLPPSPATAVEEMPVISDGYRGN